MTHDLVTGLPVEAAYEPLIREQWDSNWGYCGESSLIAAGMAFGQYASQFTLRELASPGVPQAQEASQLLLGVNDEAAARAMHLQANDYSSSDRFAGRRGRLRFVNWIHDQISTGAKVILGVYLKGGDDREYDHILPAISVMPSGVKAGRKGLLKDSLSFADNYGQALSGTFGRLLSDRRAANRSSAEPYSIPSGVANYGLAISGVADRDQVTIPVRLQASRYDEPVLSEGSLQPPTPEPLALRATVLIPDQNQSYNLYRYNDLSNVPDASFNAAAASAIQSWVIPAHSGASASFDLDVLTSDTVVFRAVPSTAL